MERIRTRCSGREFHARRTDVSWEHKEIVVRQATISLGVNERLNANAIALGIFILEHLEGFGEI